MDLPADGNPLTEEHLAQLNEALVKVATARKAIDLATRANINVATQKAAIDDLEDKVKLLKQVYFPNR